MNQLSTRERKQMVAALAEGNSLLSISRLTGGSRNTINKLLVDLGGVCSAYQKKALVNLPCKIIRCDEIWSFSVKEKNVLTEPKQHGWCDVWTWTSFCPRTKLVPCWFVGPRDANSAYQFMHDLSRRLANRVQLATDGLNGYLQATEDPFGGINFDQLIKIYGTNEAGLRNSFSKKLENHQAAIALHFMYYNFARVHQALGATPAMEAGSSDHVWDIEEIISLLDSN